MMGEKTFFEYEDVKVTNSRLMVASQTFAMSNITSVKTLKNQPNRFWPGLVIIFGVVMLLDNPLIGLVIGGGGGLWLYSQKTMFHVMLTSAGGETSALSSQQRNYIEKVVQALNDAIVARG